MSIQDIQSRKGVETLESNVASMRTLATSVKQAFQQLNSDLVSLQSQCGPQGADQLNPLLIEVKSFLGYLEEAASGEQKVDAQLKIMTDNRNYLVSSRAEIESGLPSTALSGPSLVALEELQKASMKIDTVLQDRQQKINSILALAKEDSKVRDELIREKGNADEQGIFAKAFTPMKDILHEIEVDIQCQDSYIIQLQQKLEDYNNAIKGDASLMQRQGILTTISNTISAYTTGSSYVNEGMTFYQKANNKYEELKKRFDDLKGTIQMNPMPSSNSGGEQYQQPFSPQRFPPQPYPQQPFIPQQFHPQPYPQTFAPPQFPPQPYPQQPLNGNAGPAKICKYCSCRNNAMETYCVSCGKML